MSDGRSSPSVSVVIPSNRHSSYLEEAIASLRAQTVGPDEIILVDDGSPSPGLAAVADELGLAYLRQEASGVSVARNRGAAHATGEWIAFLDDDDVWMPERVERQLAAIRARPEAIACYSDLTIIDADSEVVTVVTAPMGTSLELIRRGAGVPPINTLLVRRDVYLTIGGCRPGLRLAEDIDLVLRLLRAGEFTKAPGTLIGYRKYAGQTSSDAFSAYGSYAEVVRGLRRDARRDADRPAAAALAEHLRRTIPGFADLAAAELLSGIRHGRWRDVSRATRWGAVHTRFALIPALFRTGTRKISGGRR